jgi:hypothetical protein
VCGRDFARRAIRGEAARLGRTIEEIGAEELFEHFKGPTALILLGVPTKNSDPRWHSLCSCSSLSHVSRVLPSTERS